MAWHKNKKANFSGAKIKWRNLTSVKICKAAVVNFIFWAFLHSNKVGVPIINQECNKGLIAIEGTH